MAKTEPIRHLFVAAIYITLAMLISGCKPDADIAADARVAASGPAPYVRAKTYSLAIEGYNYSDTEIGSFSVGNGGGGNIAVSTPDSGGGGIACCATLYEALYKTTPIKVKWTRDSDVWCEAEVMIDPILPKDPNYLEVHFYQDGHIEVIATETTSAPRLSLERHDRNGRNEDARKNVNNDSRFAKCKHGYD